MDGKATKRTWAQRAVQASTGKDIEDLLRELYLEKRYSQQEIADAIGVHRVAVAKWLADFGISRDDRRPVELEATAP